MSGVKSAEKLLLLSDAGASLLDRLHVVSRTLTDPKLRPPFLSDKALEAPLKTLVKKWPDLPMDIDRAPGMQELYSRARPMFEDIEAWYYVHVDVMEWREATAQALNEMASIVQVYRFDETPHLVTSFLDVTAMYAQMLIVMSNIPDRNIVLALFNRLHHSIRTGTEPLYNRVVSFVGNYQNAVIRMSEDMKGVSSRFGLALSSLGADYLKLYDIKVMRKEGTLSITHDPTKMALPSQDNFMYLLGLTSNVYKWVTMGLLVFPEEIANSDCLNMLKHALSHAFLAPLVRDESCYLHNEYDTLYSKSNSKSLKNSLKKDSKFVSQGVQSSVAGGGVRLHYSRRIFARHELGTLLALTRDQPGLLGPKIQLVLSAMAVGRDEVLHYFRHVDRAPPKSSVKHEPRHFIDPKIMELIYLICELTALIQSNKKLIQGYYIEYLMGPDRSRCHELQNDITARSPSTAPYMASIMNTLGQINLESFLQGHECDFRTLRLNWFRVECELALVGPNLQAIAPAVQKFALMSRHSRYVDDLDRQLDEHGSLKELYYWRDSISQAFDASLNDSNARFAFSFLRLLALFPLNAFRSTPEDAPNIGNDCVSLAKGSITRMCRKILELLRVVAERFVAFDSQTAPEHAAYPFLAKLKDYKFAKDFVPPVAPGSESEFKSRAKEEALRAAQATLWSMCSALNDAHNIVIYDHVFAPRESVREAVFTFLRDFMKNLSTGPELERPSVLERKLRSCQQAAKTIQAYLDLDVDDLIREVWIQHVYHKSFSGQLLDWATDSELDLDEIMIKPIASWYTDFIARRIQPSKETEVVFSSVRHGFISKPTMAFKAERYADLTELVSLCNLVGPYGVKLLDRELLRVVLQNVLAIKDLLVANKGLLDEFSKVYFREQPTADVCKKMRPADMDAFMQRSITIGNALSLRKILHEAALLVTSQQTPYITNTVRAALDQYAPNVFSSTDYLPIDCLASDCGINVGAADHALKAYVRKGCAGSDASAWNLLPMFYALSFAASKTWAESEYRPVLEAHRTNANVLAATIHELVVSVKSVSSAGEPDEREISNVLAHFVEVSSIVLLRMLRQPAEKGRVGAQALLIFVDKFVVSSPMLSRDRFESVLPYCLLRSAYRDIYANAPKESVEGAAAAAQ